jgi:hypothetical protein
MFPWIKWEDFQAGMYRREFETVHVADAAALLSNPDEFAEVANEMVRAWPIAAHHNLKNMWTGRNAWIGQASALYAYDAPAIATRLAWGTLSLDQQRAANAIAEAVRIRREQDNVRQALFVP